MAERKIFFLLIREKLDQQEKRRKENFAARPNTQKRAGEREK